MASPCAPGTECERTNNGIVHDIDCYGSIMQNDIFGSEECCASGKCEVCAPGGFGGSRYW